MISVGSSKYYHDRSISKMNVTAQLVSDVHYNLEWSLLEFPQISQTDFQDLILTYGFFFSILFSVYKKVPLQKNL